MKLFSKTKKTSLNYPSIQEIKLLAQQDLPAIWLSARKPKWPNNPLERAKAIRAWVNSLVIDYPNLREFIFRTGKISIYKDSRWFTTDEYKLSHEGFCFFGAMSEHWKPMDDETLQDWWDEPEARYATLNVASINPTKVVQHIAKALDYQKKETN